MKKLGDSPRVFSKCEASNSTTSPTATLTGLLNVYSMRGFKPCSLRRPSKSMQAGNDSSRLGWRWSPLGSTASGYRGRYVQSFQTFYQGFAERCSMLPASCSRRVRLASMPSRPSSARRPCLAISVHSSLTCARGPSDSNREHFQPNWLASTANPLQARDASC